MPAGSQCQVEMMGGGGMSTNKQPQGSNKEIYLRR